MYSERILSSGEVLVVDMEASAAYLMAQATRKQFESLESCVDSLPHLVVNADAIHFSENELCQISKMTKNVSLLAA